MAWCALLSTRDRNRNGSVTGAGFLLKGLGHELHRDLRRHLALKVAAHAVGKDHQQCVARVRIGHAVLVGARLPTRLSWKIVNLMCPPVR
jgi:hypothetical protein